MSKATPVPPPAGAPGARPSAAPQAAERSRAGRSFRDDGHSPTLEVLDGRDRPVSSKDKAAPPGGQFLVYQTQDGKLKIDVRFEGETVWLTQQHMAELFQTSVPNVSMHIRNLFAEGELRADSVVKESLTTAADGKKYPTKFYNLDVIISVGYRVKSLRGTQFRIWATQRLREYIVKGFVLDDERLTNPDLPFDYFEELTRRIQDIRTSERRFYQKITDIYATSIDYDPTQDISVRFFQTVQNKVHWAITGQTAAEIVHDRVDAARSNLGLNNQLARCDDSQARCRHRQELPERLGAGGAQQPRGAVSDLRSGAGHAAHSHAHGRLGQEAGRVPHAQPARHPHACRAHLPRDGPGQGRAGVRQVQGRRGCRQPGGRQRFRQRGDSASEIAPPEEIQAAEALNEAETRAERNDPAGHSQHARYRRPTFPRCGNMEEAGLAGSRRRIERDHGRSAHRRSRTIPQ